MYTCVLGVCVCGLLFLRRWLNQVNVLFADKTPIALLNIEGVGEKGNKKVPHCYWY